MIFSYFDFKSKLIIIYYKLLIELTLLRSYSRQKPNKIKKAIIKPKSAIASVKAKPKIA